jgi:hypothetical protein
MPSELMRSFKYFLHVRKMPPLMYNQVNSFIIENSMILNMIQNICNLPDTEVVWQNSVAIVNLIPSIVRCSRLTVYFSTKCWYLPKSFFKDKMRRFFKKPWFNRLVLRIRWRCKSINTTFKLECSVWVVKYKLPKRDSRGRDNMVVG